MSSKREIGQLQGPGTFRPIPGLESTGYEVCSWSPDEVPGRTHPTAVLFALDVTVDGKPMQIRMRFKSREAVNRLIDSLERIAIDVWPAARKAER